MKNKIIPTDEWKIETLNQLRQYKIKTRLLKLTEIIYHTILPITFTYWLLTSKNPTFFIPLIIIIFVRIKTK